ncbi:MAG: 16S rRNA (guanine(966)-N(2))-methyltransferase RsmD [Oxalobacteraceae bacterium]|jgi:16S rRNA (guanine966-N2)-methyltransferase
MNRRSVPPRQVRIIGGHWKRTPLPVIDAQGLRPTPDRVRETLFNWLDHVQDTAWRSRRCLDLFAGSGALGFEAASRGAASVLMVDASPLVCKSLQAMREKLAAAQVEIRRADALSLLGTLEGTFDVIFLDPPYAQDMLSTALPACQRLLAPGGLVYAESDRPLAATSEPWLARWRPIREGRAGAVHFVLLAAT